ncbi:anti-anti-sigma factor [Saccharothrix tamanrassetensis]|uniref:Anti-sigma factor antagonist n=1 Tax=Saccharothrix tamanrassetensis TaxID=1051531 RepID=A0A841CQI7_9PSEU|nr:anti-sigma factor antagonist [Saccharothrix tamanrassetensis]MBB5960682.1 anti-anti-sigma factor [Saccharothrix tamanrassetensis]
MTFSSSEYLQVESGSRGPAVVVRVAGELDMHTSEVLERELRQAVDSVLPPAPVVLDLDGVTFMGSPGLSLMLEQHVRCAGRGSQFRVVASHRAVLRPLELTELDNVFAVLPTVEQALVIPEQDTPRP